MAVTPEQPRRRGTNRYARIVESVFHAHYEAGQSRVEFEREEIIGAAARLNIELPKNLGDVIYGFRYRVPLPESILATAPPGHAWIIRPAGKGRYRFALVGDTPLEPNPNLAKTKIPDATPGMIAKYAFGNEQGVLARIRYNRLLDVFLGIACYSLQNHFRTTVPDLGQIETDEIYVGVDKRGVHCGVAVPPGNAGVSPAQSHNKESLRRPLLALDQCTGRTHVPPSHPAPRLPRLPTRV